MPILSVTPSAKRRIKGDLVEFFDDKAALVDQGKAATTVDYSGLKAAAVYEVNNWPEQYVEPGAMPGMGAMVLKCGLVFPLMPHDFVIDTTRGLVAPARQNRVA